MGKPCLRAGQKAGNRNSLGARSSAVEHLTFNQRVVGSIPTGLTILFGNLVFGGKRWYGACGSFDGGWVEAVGLPQ